MLYVALFSLLPAPPKKEVQQGVTMAWLCRQRWAALLLCTVLLAQLSGTQGARPRKPVRPKAYSEEKTLFSWQESQSPKQATIIPDSTDTIRKSRRRTQGFLLEKKIGSDYLPVFATNNVCSRAFSVIPHDLVRGDVSLASLENKASVQDCILTNQPGLWYSLNGTGQVLKASIQSEEENTDDTNSQNRKNATTQIAIFRGDAGCDYLQCVQTGAPDLLTSSTNTENGNSKLSSGWATYWSTEPGVTYYLYAYGIGSFQMVLTEQTRPENDVPDGATELQIGDSLKGSTAYASADRDVVVCKNGSSDIESSEALVPGVWFKIQGTGSPFQAQLKTVVEGFVSQVSVYSNSFDCVEQVEHNEFYNLGTAAWYPISSAAVWDSIEGENYYLYIQGSNEVVNYESGSFELTIFQDARPDNDHCSFASELRVGQTVSSSTNFATMNGDLSLCNQNDATDEKLSAPGVWYLIRSIEGAHQVSVSSAFTAELTFFVGNHCSSLTCMDYSDNLSIRFADSQSPASNSVTWNASGNETYYILVHGKDSMVGDFEVSVWELSEVTAEEAADTEDPTTSNLYSVETPISLSFGFFPDTSSALSPPSTDEISALMEQVNNFYSKTFENVFGAQFIRFEAKLTNATFDGNSVLPVVVQFTAKVALLTAGSSPSSGTIFNIMDEANYQDFITKFVWQSEPVGDNPFSQTLRIEFGKEKTVAIEGDDSREAVQRIDTKAKLSFSFLPDAKLRDPTDVEIDGLLEQTNAFYSKLLTQEYESFVRLGVAATGSAFKADAQFPVIVSLEIHAFFALPHLKNSTSIVPSASEMMAAMQNVKLADFIQDYVWEAEPFSVSLFYETRHVSLTSDRPEQTNSALPASSVALNEDGQIRNLYMYPVLYFNFHETASLTLREPSYEEVHGLLNKTELFFDEILTNELPSTSGYVDLHITPAKTEYNELSEFPVAVYTKVEVALRESKDATDGLSAVQLMDLLSTADMRDYVEYYAWFAEPVGSVFFATDQAVLEPYDPLAIGAAINSPEAKLNSSTISTPSSATTVSPGEVTLVPVETDFVAKFSFFRTNYESYRVATETELEALTAQTKAFFSKVLQETYEDLVQLDVSLITAGFADNSDKPSVVAWKVNALFYVLDGSSSSRTPENLQSVLNSSNEFDYLHKYVWSADPIGSNLFFEADAVQFEPPAADNGNTDDISSTSPASSTTLSTTNELAVHGSILYGFLEDQDITRKPNANEQETILYQTTLFFNKLFRQEFGSSFQKATLTILDITLVEGDKLPLIITYEITAKFADVASVPAAQDLSHVMDSANFESYIEFYVWNADSSANNMFYDTQQVVFQGNI